MLKTFTSLESLLWEVHADRNIEGDGASTANRFPVRFVLFDNFRDCCSFVEDIAHLPHIAIQRIEDWMDEEYPDTFVSHDKLAKKILNLIRKNPTEYRIIMPFSEIARFYNNETRIEFNTLISTIKGYDTEKEGLAHKQRIYIPVVGQEFKMRQFKDDSQSFIWYYHNADRQLDYRLILTNGTTYGVQGLDTKYNIANTLLEWLGYWQFPDLKQNLISVSTSIYSHKDYAKSDNAFTFCACSNAYEFLTKGLKLDVDCIPYIEEESHYWNILASRINIENFRFEKFFNEQFGIYNLADYKVFFETWFKNKQPFMRWLLAKYYVQKFCGHGYICRVLEQLDGYSDAAFAKYLAITIFSLENPEQYIEERHEGLKQGLAHGMELAQEIQNHLVEKIKKEESDNGILSAIKYISPLSYEERKLIIEWYKDGKIEKIDLLEIYPDLYYYLSKTVAATAETWILDYMDKYKEAKVRNCYSDEVKAYIDTKNQNHVEHFKWTSKFSTTRTLLSMRSDIQSYFWIDGLGVDWVPFIAQIVKEHESEGYYLNDVYVATAKIPTRTDINKKDIDALSGGLVTKISNLDEVAHSCRPFPKFIIEDLDEIRKCIHKLLIDNPGQKIAIVSDHGLSYLSQLRQGYNLKGYKSDHYGRVAEANKKGIVNDDKYNIVPLPDGKKVALCALKHESLLAKIPDGMGCHGGCTPEEQLVPVLIISPEKSTVNWHAVFKSYDVEEANPVICYEIAGLESTQIPYIEYNNKYYKMKAVGTLFTSERLSLNKDVSRLKLHIGTWEKEDTFNIKMAVQEDDLFSF